MSSCFFVDIPMEVVEEISEEQRQTFRRMLSSDLGRLTAE